MTWRHDVTSSCKYKTDNMFELSNPKFHRNKKIIIFLAHLQAEIRKKVWVRHAVTPWRHVMAWRHHASTYTIIAWNPAIEIITEIHMYHHFRTSTSWYRRSEFCDIMTSRHDVMTSCKHKNDNKFELGKPENYRNKKKNHLSSTSTSWDRVSSVFDVMTWRHDVTSSCKYKTDNMFELSYPKFHRNKKKNHLSSTSTSWDRENKFWCVMLWRHDVTVSRGWVKSKSLNCILWMGPGAMEKWHF